MVDLRGDHDFQPGDIVVPAQDRVSLWSPITATRVGDFTSSQVGLVLAVDMQPDDWDPGWERACLVLVPGVVGIARRDLVTRR